MGIIKIINIEQKEFIWKNLSGDFTHNATAVKINDKQYIFKNGTVTYIVNSNEDGSLIMHRGNVGSIKSEDGSVCQSVNFSCGQPVDFNSELYISEKEPETSKYDHKCEECFENIEK